MLMSTAPQRQNTQSGGVSAPIKGIVAGSIYGAEGPIDMDSAIWLYNMLPSEYGCRVRPGSKEFATGLTGVESTKVRTLMYFNSVIAGGIADKYFAATDEGIFDITAGGIGPHLKVVDWATDGAYGAGGNAGWISYLNYTNVAGDHYLLVCDEKNGYFVYDGATDTWAQGTFQGTPKPLAEDLVEITEWQSRIWFVERDTARAWFLDPLALGGTITPFDVGNRFIKGGHLAQQTTWTLDDGSGLDDQFVQISSSGDVLVWKGINPDTAADMQLIGRWSVGEVPEGRRVMSDWGGDVNIISGQGITKLTALMGGEATINANSYSTRNITRYFRQEVLKTAEQYGWSLELIPGGDAAVVTVPQPPTDPNRAPIQFVLTITTNAWSMLRDLDMICQDRNNQGYFFGTSDGRVLSLGGTVDNVKLTVDPFSANWTYEGLTTNPPAVGACNYSEAAGVATVRISYTDADTNDWMAELLSLTAETQITFTDSVDSTKSVSFELTSAATDQTTYATYSALKSTTGPGGEPLPTAAPVIVSVVPKIQSDAITFSLLTHYSSLGSPAVWKRPQFIRPSWIGDSQPVYGIQMRYDFDLSEVGITPPYLDYDIAVWDSAIWDVDTWAGAAQSYLETVGLNGMGRHLAIALRGVSTTELTLVGFDLMLDQGGLL
jgi:hypothetical protein